MPGMDGDAIASAIQEGRLFAIVGPDGEDYYADLALNRMALQQVLQALRALPEASKGHFFTS